MTSEQREVLIAFVGNFVALLHDDGFSREDAETAMHAAIATLFGTVWHLSPHGSIADEIEHFTRALQRAAIKKFYGKGVVA